MEYEKETFPWILKSASQQIIVNILLQINGQKDLVISPQLIPSLDLICGLTALKSNGVEKIYKLEPGSSPGTCSRCCYLVRNDISETKTIADHINADKSQGRKGVKYWVLFVPRMLRICDKILEEEGVYGYVTILECPLFFIPIDTDLISQEQEDLFASLFLNQNQTGVYDIAKSLMQLQNLTGSIPEMQGQGKYAKMVMKLLQEFRRHEEKCGTSSTGTSARDPLITNLIILDRNVDYPSLLLSQLNYEGLLDEAFGVRCGKVHLPPEVTKNPKSEVVKHVAHSNDPVYRDIRDCHLSTAFSRLKEKGVLLKEKHMNRQDMNLNAMKDFIANELKSTQDQYKSLSLHIAACEVVTERKKEQRFVEQLRTESSLVAGQGLKESSTFIEESIIRQVSPYISLRLLCLLSLSQDGLSSKEYKYFVRLFLQSYGHDHMVTIFNLKKLGLLTEQNATAGGSLSSVTGGSSSIGSKVAAAMSVLPNRSQFKSVVRRFNLIPLTGEASALDLKNPKDPSFVFGGSYIPIACRLIEMLIINREPSAEELVKLLPGESSYWKAKGSMAFKKKVILVYFIGGATSAEISALRFLGQQKGFGLLVAVSSLTNGNQLIKQTF